MIERIDLFMPPKGRYEVLHYFTRSLAMALSHTGVRCRVLEPQHDNPQEFIEALFSDRPECTFSFNGLLPDSEGRFFCDLVHIPHVACLLDAPQHFIPLIRSTNNIITCADRFYCDFFEGLNCANVLFMPQGVDRESIHMPIEGEERPYDILLLASFIDHEAVRKTWKKQFSTSVYKTLEEAVEITLSERDVPCIQALAQALDIQSRNSGGLDPATIDFVMLLDQLEDYVNGKGRSELIQAVTGAQVHIFGVGSAEWLRPLKKCSHITPHDPVSYGEALQLMRQSKIVLNSRPTVKNGGNERIFAGIASGALVITNDNLYIHDNFKNGEEILLYQHGRWEELNQHIQRYLQEDSQRVEVVKKGQEIVANGHTWDHRAVALVSSLAPILEKRA
jgi:spore maturation protein CgeB